jgi:hypothetical protein
LEHIVMLSFRPSSAPAPLLDGPYTADPETHIVHLTDAAHYQGDNGQLFLDLHAALMQGYALCPECCGYARVVVVEDELLLARER